MQAKSESNLWGIDVSHHQGLIDWPAVAGAGVQFAYIKASDGIGYTDPQLRRNAGGANAVGIPAGYYHYAHPESNSAVAEAEAFCDIVNGLPYQLPHCLDLEGEDAAALSTADLTDWALTWMRTVQKLTGGRVMLYTGAYFARDELGKAAGEFPIWIAHYGATTPLANGTWKEWAAFQYSDNGTCPGIDGGVDMDYMEEDFYMEVTGQSKKTDFPDVEAGRWSEDEIAEVAKAGLMEGFEDCTFRPTEPVTREQLAKVVNGLLYLINSDSSAGGGGVAVGVPPVGE